MLGSTAISGMRTRLLAALLVVALLVCHGFFGAFHELSGPASAGNDADSSMAHAAAPAGGTAGGTAEGGMAGHGGGETGKGVPGHLGDSDYAAVIVLLLAGAVLSLVSVARPVRLPSAFGRPARAMRLARLLTVFTGGTDPPFSQVFRL